MITLLRLELLITAVAALTFVTLYGNPNRHGGDRGMAWHIAVFSWATGIEAASLLLLSFYVPLPAWVFLLVFGLTASAAVWRLTLYVRARRER